MEITHKNDTHETFLTVFNNKKGAATIRPLFKASVMADDMV